MEGVNIVSGGHYGLVWNSFWWLRRNLKKTIPHMSTLVPTPLQGRAMDLWAAWNSSICVSGPPCSSLAYLLWFFFRWVPDLKLKIILSWALDYQFSISEGLCLYSHLSVPVPVIYEYSFLARHRKIFPSMFCYSDLDGRLWLSFMWKHQSQVVGWSVTN